MACPTTKSSPQFPKCAGDSYDPVKWQITARCTSQDGSKAASNCSDASRVFFNDGQGAAAPLADCVVNAVGDDGRVNMVGTGCPPTAFTCSDCVGRQELTWTAVQPNKTAVAADSERTAVAAAAGVFALSDCPGGVMSLEGKISGGRVPVSAAVCLKSATNPDPLKGEKSLCKMRTASRRVGLTPNEWTDLPCTSVNTGTAEDYFQGTWTYADGAKSIRAVHSTGKDVNADTIAMQAIASLPSNTQPPLSDKLFSNITVGASLSGM